MGYEAVRVLKYNPTIKAPARFFDIQKINDYAGVRQCSVIELATHRLPLSSHFFHTISRFLQ